MKKIPKNPNWHYLKWLGIAVISILLFGIINNIDKSLSVLSFIMKVLSPIFIGVFIAIILNIPVSVFENKVFGRLTRKNGKIWSKIKRAVTISLSIICFFLIVSVILSYIIPEFIRTCQGFIEKAPKYLDDLTTTLRELVVNFHIPITPESIDLSYNVVTEWLASTIGENSIDIFHNTLATAITVFSSVWNIILGFILAIYIVATKESLSKLVKGLLYSMMSKEKVESTIKVCRLSKNAFEGFVSGQCIEVLLIGTFTFLGMCIFDFPYAPMITCIVAVTAFIPIFGAITGAAIGAFLILLVDPMKAFWFLVFIIVLQQIESNVIYPRIMGQQIGLPSLWVLVAVILGGEFFGIPGIILSVPLCSVIYTLLHEWILKKLREKKLCKNNASHIPLNPTPLSDEEFYAEDDETNDNGDKKNKKSKKDKKNKVDENNKNGKNASNSESDSKIKITQMNTKSPKNKKGKKGSKK